MSHKFKVTTRWKEGLQGEARAEGIESAVSFAVPKEFGGPGGEWSPEHFLAASIGSCVMATFLSIAKASKLEITGFESIAECGMEKGDAGFRITGVTLTPRVTVAEEKDRDRALRLLERAERLCPISNEIKSGVTVHGTVEVGG